MPKSWKLHQILIIHIILLCHINDDIDILLLHLYIEMIRSTSIYRIKWLIIAFKFNMSTCSILRSNDHGAPTRVGSRGVWGGGSMIEWIEWNSIDIGNKFIKCFQISPNPPSPKISPFQKTGHFTFTKFLDHKSIFLGDQPHPKSSHNYLVTYTVYLKNFVGFLFCQILYSDGCEIFAIHRSLQGLLCSTLRHYGVHESGPSKDINYRFSLFVTCACTEWHARI